MPTKLTAVNVFGCGLIVASAILYRFTLVPEVGPARNIVASDAGGMIANPDAEFVLVRSRDELKTALAAREMRSGRLVLIADLESGPGLIYDFGARFPAPGALGAVGDEDLASRVGEYLGQAFACAGFDMVLAPTTDLAKGSSAVGWRAMGWRRDQALALLKPLIRGMSRGGVIPVIKHYPGHGAATGDTHDTVATIELPWSEFESEDLQVFRELCQLPEVGGVMLGHLRGPASPGLGWPSGADELAMVSPFWMDRIRKDWKYEGLLVSDALVMKAAAAVPGGEAFCSSRFLDLGGDLLLGMSIVSGASRRAVLLYSAYHRDSKIIEQSAGRLDQMVKRVFEQREINRSLTTDEVLARGEPLALEVARRALLSSGTWMRPMKLEDVDCYLAIEHGQPSKYSNTESAVKKLGCRFRGNYRFDGDTTHAASLVMVYGFLSDPALSPAEIEILAARAKSGKVLGVVVCGWPGLMFDLNKAGIPALATWSSCDASMTAAAEWLRGSAPSPGTWPYMPPAQMQDTQ